MEVRINELVNLIKTQKQKIVDDFLNVLPEKELIQQLITVYLSFKRAEKQKLPFRRLKKECDKIEDELEEKLGEEFVEKMQFILSDCEELASWEMELEERLKGKIFLIESQKETLEKVTYKKDNKDDNKKLQSQETLHKLELELANTKGQLEVYKKHESNSLSQTIISNYGQLAIGDHSNFTNQINNNYQQILQTIEQSICQSLISQEISLTEQKVINKAIIFLGTRELFLNYRQELIGNLIDSYCQLAKKNKFTKFANHATQLMNISSKLAGSIPGGTVTQSPLSSLDIIINLTQTTLQEKDLKKYLKKLQEIFTKDQEGLNLFDENYRALIDVIHFNDQSALVKKIIEILQLDQNQLTLFKNNHNIYKLGDIWEPNLSNLNLEEIKIFLEKLDKKLAEFQQEFQGQRKELASQKWFKAIEQNTDLLQKKKSNN